MLRRAVMRTEREGSTLHLCAVTILTSLDDHDLGELGVCGDTNANAGPVASDAARRLARLAFEEGIRRFVCSPFEVARLREDLGPDAIFITPGIRDSSQHGSDDQKRVATAANAISRGADWLVVGRPIRDAEDRRAAALAFRDEALLAMRSK